MAIDKKFTDFNQKMKAMKEEALKDVIADTTMSKVEKLEFISQNNLMRTSSSWCDPFEKYLDAYISKVIETPEFKEKWGKYNVTNFRNYVTTDDYFVNRDYQRHEVIDLADLATDVSEYHKPTDKITIYSNRSTKDICQITPQEFVDTIYDWVIENNTIAFELDW